MPALGNVTTGLAPVGELRPSGFEHLTKSNRVGKVTAITSKLA
jgi:hypothetical protein